MKAHRVPAALALFLHFIVLVLQSPAAGPADDIVTACRRGDLKSFRSAADNYTGDINAQSVDLQGRTLLQWAVQASRGREKERLEIVRLLLARGASASARSKTGESVLGCAISADWSPALLSLLIEAGADPDVATAEPAGTTPLCVAARNLDTDLVAYLVSHGANPDKAEAETANTPLMSLFGANRDWGQWPGLVSRRQKQRAIEIVRQLFEAGADPNIRNSAGETALHWAAQANDLSCILELLSWKADPTARDESGRNVLHHAILNVKRFDAGAFEGLMAASRSLINEPDNAGDTPLHLAVQFGNNRAVKALLFLGVATSARNAKGDRPIDSQGANNLDNEVHEVLTRMSAEPNPPRDVPDRWSKPPFRPKSV